MNRRIILIGNDPERSAMATFLRMHVMGWEVVEQEPEPLRLDHFKNLEIERKELQTMNRAERRKMNRNGRL